MGDKLPPKFTTKPSLKQEGSAIVFSCEIEASPKPEFTWFRGDTLLEVNKDRITVKIENVAQKANTYIISLIIANVTPNDSGSYKVEAKNQFGAMASNINLNLQAGAQTKGAGAPSFTQKPAIKQADGGKKILFECRMAADPKPEIAWFKGDMQLSDSGRYRFILTEEKKGEYYCALELSNPAGGDGGTYKLNAKNSAGQSNANLKLNLDVAGGAKGEMPKFTGKPSIRMVGSGVIFEVRLTGDPAPSCTWYKGDTVISAGGRFRITSQFDGSSYIVVLEISDVTVEDGGAYKVTAKNDQGTANANLNLNLEGQQQQQQQQIIKPVVQGMPGIQLINNGKTIVIRFVVTSQVSPSCVWSFGGKMIKSGGNHRMDVVQEGGNYVLVMEVDSASSNSSGEYKCVMKNDGGEITKTIQIDYEALMQEMGFQEEQKDEKVDKKKKKVEDKKAEEKKAAEKKAAEEQAKATEKKKAEAAKKKDEEEKKKVQEKQKAEEQQQAELAKKKAEEEKNKEEAEKKIKEEAQKQEEAKKKVEEEKKKTVEEAKKKEEEQKKKAAEEKKEEEQKKKAAEEAKKKEEEQKKKKQEEEKKEEASKKKKVPTATLR